MYEERRYRDIFKGANLQFFDICIKETDIKIGADKVLKEDAFRIVSRLRNDIETYIKRHGDFKTSLKPIECYNDAPDIIKEMCEAARKTGVGPMASVAGAISQTLGLELLEFCNEVIVENGGDIFIKSNTPRKVGIYAGQSRLSQRVALEIMPHKTPLGICTSSGTVGHSLSFGKADAVVITSKDTFLADAAATAVGNIIKNGEFIKKE